MATTSGMESVSRPSPPTTITPSRSTATRRPTTLAPVVVSTSNEFGLVRRASFTHSIASVPASSVEYSSLPRLSHFTSPVIRSPFRRVSTSVLTARAGEGSTRDARAKKATRRHRSRIGRRLTVRHDNGPGRKHLEPVSIRGARVRHDGRGGDGARPRKLKEISIRKGGNKMRFMVLVKADKQSEAGAMPSREMLEAMGKFNEQLIQAGVMLAGEGLHPSSKGARVRFQGGKKTVIDGPFAETKELIAGFWIWQVKSRDEAIEWLKKAPFEGTEVEIRQVFETEDFG